MKNLILITMITAFLASLALGGCTTTQNTGSSSHGKKKSSYEDRRNEGSGGY